MSQLTVATESPPGYDHLLLDWPSPKQKKATVAFAKHAHVYVYKCSSSYRSKMSYSSQEVKIFRVQAAQEALRITALTSVLPNNTGTALKYLIRENIVTRDEIVGIEHLIGEEMRQQWRFNKSAHSALVLIAQEDMEERNESSVETLAQMSMASSCESVQKARVKAFLVR